MIQSVPEEDWEYLMVVIQQETDGITIANYKELHAANTYVHLEKDSLSSQDSDK